MRLLGMDFETANQSRGSICQAGLALLEDGKVVRRQEWLVKPHRSLCWFARGCTMVHGLDYWDVRYAQEFPAIWPQMTELLQQADMVVAHNASFDMAQLRAVLDIYDLPHIQFNYTCSMLTCRKLLPLNKPHTLDAMAEYFGHSFRHHDALEDAEACAVILSHTGIIDKYTKTFQ